MGMLNFSRFGPKGLIIREDRLFDAALTFTRSDGVTVDFTSKTILFKIYTERGGTLVDTLSSGTEIAISNNILTFTKIFTDLESKTYFFELYNDTDKITLMMNKMVVL